MQTTWLDTLRYWASQNGKQAKVKLAYETGIGYDTIGRILRGERKPDKTEQIALCKVTGMKMKDFSSDCESEKQSA